MPLYTWDPVPTFVARQINTLEDVDLWVEEMAAAGLMGPKDGWTFSDFSGSPVENDPERFLFQYTVVTDIDGQSRMSQRVPFGYWGIANGLDAINLPRFESDAEAQRRYQPFSGLA